MEWMQNFCRCKKVGEVMPGAVAGEEGLDLWSGSGHCTSAQQGGCLVVKHCPLLSDLLQVQLKPEVQEAHGCHLLSALGHRAGWGRDMVGQVENYPAQ